MKVQYRITENDYANLARFHAWRHFIARPSAKQLVAFIVALLCIGLWIGPAAALIFVIVVAVFVILFAVGLFLLTPSRARRHYRQYKAMQEPIAAELTETGVKFSNGDGEAILPWSKVFQWRQNDQFVLIYGMPILYYIVPKSIGREGFDIPLLVQRLAEHVGPER
jgi:Na+/melibiose symporter-like transporter